METVGDTLNTLTVVAEQKLQHIIAKAAFKRLVEKHGFTTAGEPLLLDKARTCVEKRLRRSIEECLTTAILSADKKGHACIAREAGAMRKRARMCLWTHQADSL